jgi:hypothetical protein
MKIQYLSSGSTVVVYGDPAPYQSPLSIVENWPSIVIYADSKTNHQVGVVYKAGDDRWYLSSVYLKNWNPIEVFAKYAGFLFLNSLHSKRNG